MVLVMITMKTTIMIMVRMLMMLRVISRSESQSVV